MELLLSVTSKTGDSSQEARCELNGRLVLGRTPDSPVPLDGPGVSREHLVFENEGDEVFVIDLSSNGSWVNGERLARARRHPVQPGDVIELPGYEIRFRVPAAEVTRPVPEESVAIAPAEPGAVPAPVEPLAAAPPEKKSFLAPLGDFVGTFSGLEKFMILMDLLAIVLLALYLTA